MLGFDKFFHKKIEAPAEEQSTGDGSLSPEHREVNYDALEEGQVWVSGETRLRIKCLDPANAYEYGVGEKFYDDVNALKKELSEGNFTLEVKKETTEQSADVQYVGAAPAQAVSRESSSEPGLRVPVKAEEVPSHSESPAEKAAYDNLNTEIESNISELERVENEINTLLDEGVELSLNENDKSAFNALFSEMTAFFEKEVNACIQNDDVLDKEVLESGLEAGRLAQKRKNASELSQFVERAAQYVTRLKQEIEKMKELSEKKGRVVSLETHSEFAPQGKQVESKKRADTLSLVQLSLVQQEQKENILDQLRSERRELEQLMRRHERELAMRRRTGWISSAEAKKIEQALDKSDSIIRKTLIELVNRKVSLDDAQRRLRAMQEELPMVRIQKEQRQNLEVIRLQDGGEEYIEALESALIEAMRDFYAELSTHEEGEIKDEHWIEVVLPELERKALATLKGISSDVEINESALQGLLGEIAKKVK